MVKQYTSIISSFYPRNIIVLSITLQKRQLGQTFKWLVNVQTLNAVQAKEYAYIKMPVLCLITLLTGLDSAVVERPHTVREVPGSIPGVG